MNERLAYVCRKAQGQGERLLMTAIVAADPYLDATLDYMRVLADEGADMIELIFPFSDPTYHGAVIQRASARALREEVSWDEIIELGQQFRETHDTPVFFSTYYNRILARGIDTFVDCLLEAKFDGAMVTDLPWEEGEALRTALRANNLALPAAVAPTTTTERFAQIAAGCDSFLIWTGHSGGEPTISNQQFAERMKEFRQSSDSPILASMKISTGYDAQAVAPHCDGVLVGSALVWLVEGRGPNFTESLAGFVRELRLGVDGKLETPGEDAPQ
ncbi:tryptophan synthase subunit alpha [Persicimonas caeni]|uniref:Tryptophan synthase alpha chain n=1 Tax=Persicimonas caeni TaxID=2292766 RepID=A0A4Y6Q1G7_PERCE|nr:tryptophan synthase subunit alpha [Persicimonas caeni]QDG54428.1 tryptophan synthase subunit alpha [Persicimonas caeni]QED35649.1 tryptophan synthase subunit alpha [Persicimonas caeni]